MSLPASLTKDCGGLLNRRFSRAKALLSHGALHVGYHVYSSHGLFLSRIIEFLFTRRVTESLGIYVTNYRIVEFLFTRRVTEVFFVTRHVLGHEFANYRISFFTRNVADGRGGCEGGMIEA